MKNIQISKQELFPLHFTFFSLLASFLKPCCYCVFPNSFLFWFSNLNRIKVICLTMGTFFFFNNCTCQSMLLTFRGKTEFYKMLLTAKGFAGPCSAQVLVSKLFSGPGKN